jgi:hypothetical protein
VRLRVIESCRIDLDDGGMVDEPVDGGDGEGGIGEHLVPFTERLVAGDDETFALVAFGDQFEQDCGLA